MKICKKCVLPETYPGISFDEQGVCNFCNDYKVKDKQKLHFDNEEELKKALEKYKNINKKYDVLVPLSGGVDSSSTLIKLVRDYNLKPLGYHNDHGYEDETATNNVRKLCRALGVDLIITQHEADFMKKLWKYTYECDVYGLTSCFPCANILYMNAIEVADKYGINLVVNGYSKGQAEMINDKSLGVNMLKEMQNIIRKRKDREFYDQFMNKFNKLSKISSYHTREDLEKPVNLDKILVVPFFVFKFNKTDKEVLKNEIRKVFDWQPIPLSYPSRTTNCKMNWLGTYIDRIKMGFSVYDAEYAEIVRAGDFTREQALKDLEHNPEDGLLEKLADEVGVDLKSFKPLSNI